MPGYGVKMSISMIDEICDHPSIMIIKIDSGQ